MGWLHAAFQPGGAQHLLFLQRACQRSRLRLHSGIACRWLDDMLKSLQAVLEKQI
jgi:hypothetical protein